MLLNFVPRNSSFLDITASGDEVSISDWVFPDIPSLSDHPYITFSLTPSGPPRPDCPRTKSNLFPNPKLCCLDTFHSALSRKAGLLSPLTSFCSSDEIDVHITSLIDTLKECALLSKLPFHRRPSQIPWWRKELWALRHRLRRAFQLKSRTLSPLNESSYRFLKAKYQRQLRRAKETSWKNFCSENLGGDVQDAIVKKISKRMC